MIRLYHYHNSSLHNNTIAHTRTNTKTRALKTMLVPINTRTRQNRQPIHIWNYYIHRDEMSERESAGARGQFDEICVGCFFCFCFFFIRQFFSFRLFWFRSVLRSSQHRADQSEWKERNGKPTWTLRVRARDNCVPRHSFSHHDVSSVRIGLAFIR